VDDFNGCRITIERIRTGTEISAAETFESWEGVIYKGPADPHSGGDDYFALLGDFPMQYGIWAMEDTLRAELEALRDTGTPIRIWGTIVAGIPDWNGTQITVERFERVDIPSGDIPAAPDYPEVKLIDGWLIYTNDRYGYWIQYPPQATLLESGVMGYPSDGSGNPVGGLPEGVTIDTYIEYLEQTYGTNLCIQIQTTLGYLNISAPENEGFKYANCGRTGVGVATITAFELELRVDGKYYTARGMDVQAGGESLIDHNETVHMILDDGTRIEFGARPVAGATFEDYLMKGRPLLLNILETYLSVR
jgi:hypothetical protein